MPLERPQDFGTNELGYRVNDYCRYCYRDGAFTDPNISLPQMIEQCATIMAARRIMSVGEARALLSEVLPRTKRWRTKAVPVGAAPGVGGRGLAAGDEEC